MFKDHPNIKNIRAKKIKSDFLIKHRNKIETQKYIRDMEAYKNCKLKLIPTKVI